MNCEIEVTSVEETRYHEFGNALSENDVMELMFLKLPDDSKNPPLLFHINQLLVVNMIDQMLGGEGSETELDFEYTYTDIELALYGRLVKYFSGAIRDSWKNYLALDVDNLRLEQWLGRTCGNRHVKHDFAGCQRLHKHLHTREFAHEHILNH